MRNYCARWRRSPLCGVWISLGALDRAHHAHHRVVAAPLLVHGPRLPGLPRWLRRRAHPRRFVASGHRLARPVICGGPLEIAIASRRLIGSLEHRVALNSPGTTPILVAADIITLAVHRGHASRVPPGSPQRQGHRLLPDQQAPHPDLFLRVHHHQPVRHPAADLVERKPHPRSDTRLWIFLLLPAWPSGRRPGPRPRPRSPSPAGRPASSSNSADSSNSALLRIDVKRRDPDN